MKKINISYILMLALLPMLWACSKEEIIFDSELPQFETRAGYQLLEVIVPQNTSATDKIYIAGAFNGGAEAAAGDPRWELEKAPKTDAKWGIYLNPADFAEGTSLADGYRFISVEQGEERTLANSEALHTEAPAAGSRLNVTVERWAAYFDTPQNPDEIEHDGYVIYVVDNSGFSDLAMYAWGDAEAFGGWPGIKMTGTVAIDGTTYKYFDTGEANKGLSVNLIFNDNGGGQQLGDYSVTLDRDYYLELTPGGVLEYDPSASVTHDGFAVFVYDQSGWSDLYLYMWGDTNDLNGAWPGMSPTGTQTINGVTYKYFDLGEANIGQNEHVILNDGDATQIDDVVVFACDRDVYIELKGGKATEIDPETYQPSGDTPVTPDPDPTPDPDATYYSIYVEDNTGWDNLYIYAWGDKETFGGWPGKECDRTTTIAGVTYKVWTVAGAGETENLIFNDNAGLQYDAATVTLDRDYTFSAGSESAISKKPVKIVRKR
ncbi:MAG: starch-binding protein [Muribaculaceae bacterium]|nr:starch-binding protein [Muribaculaceae bacterium]